MLSAWLAFAFAASGLPFLIMAVVFEPDGHGAWVVTGGGVHRWSITRAQGAQMGEPDTMMRWDPSAESWAYFSYGRLNLSGLLTPGSVLIIGAPVWPFLLAPTLLALGVRHGRHAIHQRRQNRERALGRTPCPTCGYDATDLTTCPECGATMHTHTESQP